MKTSLSLFVLTVFLTGCVCLDPAHHQKVPPSAQTQGVIDSLKQIRTDLDRAGEENASVDKKLKSAISLAERLDVLLEQIEAIFNAGKTTVKPE